jgi:hypothetical protein
VSGCARDGRLPGERGAEEQRWREDVVPDGKEVSVTASLVLRLDPSTVENFSYDRHSTWAGSITLVHDEEGVDLFDAAPGILRMPDDRESEFMATGGRAGESGCSGLGPAPFHSA